MYGRENVSGRLEHSLGLTFLTVFRNVSSVLIVIRGFKVVFVS